MFPSGNFTLCTILAIVRPCRDLPVSVFNAGVELRCQENSLVAGDGFFKRPHGTFAANDERTHLLREDYKFAHRHHRHALLVVLFPVKNGFLIWQMGSLEWFLSGFLQQAPVNFTAAHHIRRDNKIAHTALGRQVVHQIEH